MAIALSERFGLGFMAQYVYSTAGEIAIARRELDAAEAAFGRAFEGARAWDNQSQMANVRANQALVALARREPLLAHTLLAEARTLLSDGGDRFVRDQIAQAATEAAALQVSGPDSGSAPRHR